MLEKDIQSIGRLTNQKITQASDALKEEIAGQGEQVEKQCRDIIALLEKELGTLDSEFDQRLKRELEEQQATHKAEIDAINGRLIEQESLDQLGSEFDERLNAEVASHKTEIDSLKEQLTEQADNLSSGFGERIDTELENQQSIYKAAVESITERLAEEKALVVESIEAINAQLEQRIDLEQKLVERIDTIKDGEQGEQGEKGEAGTDGLDRPVLEPVHLKADKDYPKNTLGLYKGGLWISTKDALGYPQDDPHSWHCILDAMNTLSVDLQEDRNYKLSIETSAGNVIENNFHIPYPEHKGIWEEGEYAKGDIVTKGHSMFHAVENTSGQPPGNGWQQILTAQRGRDGKSIIGPQGVPGRNGLDAKLPDGFIEEVLELASQSKAFDDGRSGAEVITSFRGYFLSDESYNRGDVVNLDGGLYVCTSSGQFDSIAKSQDSWELMLNVPKFTSPAYMDYKGQYEQKTYKGGDVVVDGDWTMCALTQTTDRAAPFPIGDPTYLFQGVLAPFENTVKQVVFGNRYYFETGGYLNGFRINLVTGQRYSVYSVSNPTTNPLVNPVIAFTADEDGWRNFSIPSAIVSDGSFFDLIAFCDQPNDTPVTFTGDWDYDSPPVAVIPPAGVILQANDNPASLRVSILDDTATDRSAELDLLTNGDTISDGVIVWTITNVVDNGTWYDFTVSPNQQSPTDGIREFTFETVVATPITVGRDVDYWQASPAAAGLFSDTGSYESIVPDDNAYGIDILVQRASVSPDWGLVAFSGGGGSGGSAGITVTYTSALNAESLVDQDPSGLGVALQLTLGDPQTTDYFDVDAAGNVTCLVADTYEAILEASTGRAGNTGSSQIYIRVLVDGVQSGASSHTILDTANFELPATYTGTLSLDVGQVVTVEIIRDTDGDDSGGVRAGVPDVVGWNTSPSVSLQFSKVSS